MGDIVMELMKAIQLTGPCEIDAMTPVEIEKPQLRPGFAVVKVKAFGINQSEVFSRKGLSSLDFSYPRVLGIEGVGVLEEVNSDSSFRVGDQVATMMSGLGRSLNGFYAEYMLVPEKHLLPFSSELPWHILGALPEMMQTAYGSLTKGLLMKLGDILFIHGGTSSVGLMATLLAKDIGVTVISSTRRISNIDILKQYGVDHVVLDDGTLDKQIREIAPYGVDGVLELVGSNVVMGDLSYIKVGGHLYFTGALNQQWIIPEFDCFSVPSGVFFTIYSGEFEDLPINIFYDMLRRLERNEVQLPIGGVYHELDAVREAHQDIDAGKHTGKKVVVLS